MSMMAQKVNNRVQSVTVAPVFSTASGRGVLPEDHALALCSTVSAATSIRSMNFSIYRIWCSCLAASLDSQERYAFN
jgi:hypothetical protein